MRFKIVTVTLADDVNVDGYGIFAAGTYWVEMPMNYDPARIIAADVIHDNLITVVDGD